MSTVLCLLFTRSIHAALAAATVAAIIAATVVAAATMAPCIQRGTCQVFCCRRSVQAQSSLANPQQHDRYTASRRYPLPPRHLPGDSENSPTGNPVGRLGSAARLVGRIGSGVRVSASFQIFALRMLLHSAGVTSGYFLWGVIFGGGGVSSGLS